jgi:hypothetical protein
MEHFSPWRLLLLSSPVFKIEGAWTTLLCRCPPPIISSRVCSERHQANPLELWKSTMLKFFLMACAGICISLGIACMLSPRFFQTSLASTSLGEFWKTHVGDRFGGFAARLLYGLAHFVIAAVLLFIAYSRH